MNGQSPQELWETFAPHLQRIVRRVWRRQLAPKLGDREETFVRDATRQIFDSLTVPLRVTAHAGCELQNTIAMHVPRFVARMQTTWRSAMKAPTTLRLGSAVIVSLDGRRFTFQDPHNPHNVVTIEDADVVDLIVFLHQHSRKAAQAIKIEVLPT